MYQEPIYLAFVIHCCKSLVSGAGIVSLKSIFFTSFLNDVHRFFSLNNLSAFLNAVHHENTLSLPNSLNF